MELDHLPGLVRTHTGIQGENTARASLSPTHTRTRAHAHTHTINLGTILHKASLINKLNKAITTVSKLIISKSDIKMVLNIRQEMETEIYL